MANTQAVCNSFKSELLNGIHALGTDTIKVALYLETATLNSATTAYTSLGETSAVGGYSTSGQNVSATSATLSSTTAVWTPTASFAWTSATFSSPVNTCLLYNASKSNRAISVHTFGSVQITAGTFTLTMPANTSTTALLRLA